MHFFLSVCDLNVVHMNVPSRLKREQKHFFVRKVKGVVDHCFVTRWLKKFSLLGMSFASVSMCRDPLENFA